MEAAVSEGGKAGLVEGGKPGLNSRERALLEEVEELKAVLGEAHIELRVWKRSAELGWHVSTTQNHRDAIETVEQAISESERLTGRPLAELLADPVTGEIRPIALVTDNGPCFKSVRFAAYIERRPELIHIRTRRKGPNQNGVRERAFGSINNDQTIKSNELKTLPLA